MITTAPRIVIVGGVAGGASAAAKARRTNEHANITLFERGPFVSFANCGLPYYVGGDIAQRDAAVVADRLQVDHLVAIRVGQSDVDALALGQRAHARCGDGQHL